jgi:hypothetical protein
MQKGIKVMGGVLRLAEQARGWFIMLFGKVAETDSVMLIGAILSGNFCRDCLHSTPQRTGKFSRTR